MRQVKGGKGARFWRPRGMHTFAVVAAILWSGLVPAQTWKGIRISGSGASGWQPVVCDNSGGGWRSCEMPINLELIANPVSLPATGQVATITARLTDYYGVGLGEGINVQWTTTSGSLSAAQSETNEDSVATVQLRSSNVIGNATVTAITSEDGGTGQIIIPFTDQWIPIAPLYTAWADYGGPYNCSPWTPDASTVTSGSSFTQSATCSQNQIAYRQDREQSSVSGAVRNVGGAQPLYQTIQVTRTQSAVGTKPADVSIGGDPEASYYGMSNNRVDVNMAFNYDLSLPSGGSTSAFMISGYGIEVRKISDTRYQFVVQRTGTFTSTVRFTATNGGATVFKDVNVRIQVYYSGGGH
ncbi:Hypothetical protein (plasmid) [Pseudomonas putida]|nr:Ig-like domain-containing protein [Pseudomonas sp.]QDQ70255.1 hypothetical protein pJBCL41_00159 [Pseudomonas sp.]QIZ22977.1 Hypothetical protein [Pseudomonas putida]